MGCWTTDLSESVKRGERVNYICVDRGTERCPCHLMEAGQCYTCTMVREGVCNCEDAAGWQGSCPYTEYLQQGGRVLESESDCLSQFDVLNKISYGSSLYMVRLDVPLGFAERCRRPGAYVMAEALGWRTPVSVLRAEALTGGRGTVDFLVKAAGPKTLALTADGCTRWKVAGPYENGLLHGERRWKGMLGQAPGNDMLVVARGTAAAPLINLLHSPEVPENLKECWRILLDDEALPEGFKEEYLNGWEYERVSLTDGEELERVRGLVRERLRKQATETSEHRPDALAALFVSQYYAEKLMEGLTAAEKNRVILPNPANLCCAMGLCGACSHTDQDGVTVRLCKCSRAVVE